MGCCNKVKVPQSQRNVIQAVRRSRATKSNRAPAGTLAKICQNCYTKIISDTCQVCGQKILKSS